MTGQIRLWVGRAARLIWAIRPKCVVCGRPGNLFGHSNYHLLCLFRERLEAALAGYSAGSEPANVTPIYGPPGTFEQPLK